MGSDIHTTRDALLKIDGTEVIEENEGADHSAPCEGENPPDLQAVTQVAPPPFYQLHHLAPQ